ncbi:hypothetical protein ACFX1T_044786 [Malus domestica]
MNYKSNPTRPIPRVPTPIFRNPIVRRMCCARTYTYTHTHTAVPFSASSLYQHNNQTTTLFLSHLFPLIVFNFFNPW